MEANSAEQSAPTTPVTTITVSQSAHLADDQADASVKTSNKQRQRTRRACYPCSKRKIKCDRDERTPCSNCAKRPNAELCTFDDDRPRSARPRHTVSTASPTPGSGDVVRDRISPDSLLRGYTTAGAPYALPQEEHKVLVQHDNGILRTIALDPKPPALNKTIVTSQKYNLVPDALPTPPHATYNSLPHTSFSSGNQHPTVNPNGLFSPPTICGGPNSILTIEEFRKLLPATKHVSKYCETYNTKSHEFCPVDIGLPHVQELSFQYIHNRLGETAIAHLENRANDLFRGEVVNIALISAATAEGVQLSDLEEDARKSLLRQYVSQTMQLLRIADAFAYPCIAAFPVALILTRVLQNELEPFLSWSMLGTTRRLAELYLMMGRMDSYGEESRYLRSEENLQRVRLRQEAFLGLLLGQTHNMDTAPYPDTRNWNGAGYVQCMDGFAAVASCCEHEDISREDALFRHTEAIKNLAPLAQYALPHLADKQKCRNVSELTQYSTLRIHERLVHLHYCQIIMAACRRLSGHEEQYFQTVEQCQTAARDGVGAYLELLAYSTMPLRSWTLTVAAMRSALVLGALLAEANPPVTESQQDRALLVRLLDSFTNTHDDSNADRVRWLKRYPDVFRRLQEMCDLLGKDADGRPVTANGVTDGPETGTALKWMTRETKDDIMIPSRLFRTYLALPASDEPFTLHSSYTSKEMLLGI